MNEEKLIDDQMPVDEDDQITVVKYTKLLKKCEQIRMENFRLINYIDQINRLVRKVRKQNAFIANKLDQNNDNYKVKPSILKEIELVINYGKSKIVKENTNSTKIKHLNKQIGDNEQTIDHRNKRIKLEQEDHLMHGNLDEFIVT